MSHSRPKERERTSHKRKDEKKNQDSEWGEWSRWEWDFEEGCFIRERWNAKGECSLERDISGAAAPDEPRTAVDATQEGQLLMKNRLDIDYRTGEEYRIGQGFHENPINEEPTHDSGSSVSHSHESRQSQFGSYPSNPVASSLGLSNYQNPSQGYFQSSSSVNTRPPPVISFSAPITVPRGNNPGFGGSTAQNPVRSYGPSYMSHTEKDFSRLSLSGQTTQSGSESFHQGSYSSRSQLYSAYDSTQGNPAVSGGGNLGTYDRDDEVGPNIGERDDARKYRRKSIATEQGKNAGRYDKRYEEKEYEEYDQQEQEPDELNEQDDRCDDDDDDDEDGHDGDGQDDDDESYPPGPSANVGEDNSSRESKKISKGDVLSTRNPDIRKTTLYKRFKVHRSSEFKKGRIFKILWPEPAGAAEGASRGTEPLYIQNSNYDQKVYSTIRRFVIVKAKKGHCMCVPILTYGSQGTAKPGVKAKDHAIIYTSAEPPELLPNEPYLPKTPIKVRVDSSREVLKPESRVNYSKVYTVEHNVKVCFIGSIHIDSERTFHTDFKRTFDDEE